MLQKVACVNTKAKALSVLVLCEYNKPAKKQLKTSSLYKHSLEESLADKLARCVRSLRLRNSNNVAQTFVRPTSIVKARQYARLKREQLSHEERHTWYVCMPLRLSSPTTPSLDERGSRPTRSSRSRTRNEE